MVLKHSRIRSGKNEHPLENESIFDKNRKYAIQQATFGPLKELLQGFLTCREQETSNECNVQILTGSCGVQSNGRPTLAQILQTE